MHGSHLITQPFNYSNNMSILTVTRIMDPGVVSNTNAAPTRRLLFFSLDHRPDLFVLRKVGQKHARLRVVLIVLQRLS